MPKSPKAAGYSRVESADLDAAGGDDGAVSDGGGGYHSSHGVLSRLTFWWVTPLFKAGMKRQINLEGVCARVCAVRACARVCVYLCVRACACDICSPALSIPAIEHCCCLRRAGCMQHTDSKFTTVPTVPAFPDLPGLNTGAMYWMGLHLAPMLERAEAQLAESRKPGKNFVARSCVRTAALSFGLLGFHCLAIYLRQCLSVRFRSIRLLYVFPRVFWGDMLGAFLLDAGTQVKLAGPVSCPALPCPAIS
eukprot:SAG22_NODE_4325_length_1303_cov_1.249169_1_plen_250_part_00